MIPSRTWCAIRELQNNRQIVIKPADKGSKIVLMDKQQYRLEANRQLEDEKYYKNIPSSIQTVVQLQIRQIVRQLFHKKYISAKQRDYLLGSDDPRSRQFYLLPKIHKWPDTWTRPIVSDCNNHNTLISLPQASKLFKIYIPLLAGNPSHGCA